VVRDTLLAVIMIMLNGMAGTSLLLGAWRHREQLYNLQGANAYLSVIIPLAVLSLITPNYTQTAPGPTLSGPQQTFLGLMCVGLYAAFLSVQTGRHRGYFMLGMEDDGAQHAAGGGGGSWGLHALLLVAYMVPLVYLAEQFGRPIDTSSQPFMHRSRSAAPSSQRSSRRRRRSARYVRRWRIICSDPSTSAWARCSPRSASQFPSCWWSATCWEPRFIWVCRTRAS
jgi:hypothetical protein